MELVLGVQRPHRLAADSMIQRRVREKERHREREGEREREREKQREREGVSEKSVRSLAGRVSD